MHQMIKNFIKKKINYLIDKRTKNLASNLGRVERSHIMDCAFEFVTKSDMDGSYFEFGCFSGGSFTRAFKAYQFWLKAAKKNNWSLKPNMMYAFDSFQA